MPINCPESYPGYDVCLTCRERNGDECWAYMPWVPAVKLSDILTNDERIATLEDRPEIPEVINDKIYKSLQRRILLLEEKLNLHIDKSAKPKSSYE